MDYLTYYQKEQSAAAGHHDTTLPCTEYHNVGIFNVVR